MLLTDIKHELAGISAQQVQCVAVSKGHDVSSMAVLHLQGQRHFAENYLQEAVEKQRLWAVKNVVWHFIGRLQTNKCAKIAQCFDWVQTVSQIRHVKLLGRHRLLTQLPLNLLIQIVPDSLPHEYAARFEEVTELLEEINCHANLCVRGLMAMPPVSMDLAERFEFFLKVHDFYSNHADDWGLDTLSMGMSVDYHEAIKAGSTMVRLGTLLLGARGHR